MSSVLQKVCGLLAEFVEATDEADADPGAGLARLRVLADAARWVRELPEASPHEDEIGYLRLVCRAVVERNGLRHTARAIGITPTALQEFITDETRMPYSRTRSKLRVWLKSITPEESEAVEETPTRFLGAAHAFYGSGA